MESSENGETSRTWLGSSLSDVCKGKGPWSFSVNPVSASKYHAVLYNLPVTLKNPPEPHYNYQPQHWDEDHVRMPYSEKNVFPAVENGKDDIILRWDIIKESLSKDIKDSRELEAAIMTYNSNWPEFIALHCFFEEVLEKEEANHFFTNILPKVIKLALQLPEIVPGSFPLLKRNHNRSVSLSQLQIACLLANAFLCTFPSGKDLATLCPGVNFLRLFTSHTKPKRQSTVSEKLKCILHYFNRVTKTSPLGAVTFERKFIPRKSMPRWDASKNNLGNTKIHIDSSGTIEDGGLGFLQVDFANRNVGGGVLGYGCVQEEIRFVICPELLISRLFVEQLGDHEAVIVTGPERYSKYSGYGETFKWDGNFQDETPFDEYGRRITAICIIDATHFNRPSDQFFPSAILRELNKAYVGFSSREKDNLAPVATGNWGCGAFRGSSELKSLIQLMACSMAGRDLVYFSFGDEELRDQFYNMQMFLANNRITITQLWRFLCGFSTLGLAKEKLYSYIQQAFFDSKKQPTIKKFFGVNSKKKDNETASTSSGENNKPKNERDKKSYDSESKKKPIEKKSPEPMDISDLFDNDDDVIPSTPPGEIVYKNKVTRTKFKPSRDDVTKKLPKTDVAELINIIDGNAIKPKETNKEEGFLSEIDKLRKESKNRDSEEKRPSKVEQHETMINIEEFVYEESVSILNNTAEGSKSSKRKITDYFQLKSSKSS